MVTIKQIAQEVGISPSTVSIVLSGKAAERKVCQDDQQIFVRELSGGRHAVALINTADQDRRITVDFRSLGLTGKYRLRDIWAHKQIASKATKWTGTVASHETKVWVLE